MNEVDRDQLLPPPAQPMREVGPTAQDRPEGHRRWFNCEDMDLFLWQDPAGVPTRIQLCYSDLADSHALTWDREQGFHHDRVDEGESRPARHKMAPMLLANGALDKSALAEAVRRRAGELEPDLVARVLRMIAEFDA